MILRTPFSIASTLKLCFLHKPLHTTPALSSPVPRLILLALPLSLCLSYTSHVALFFCYLNEPNNFTRYSFFLQSSSFYLLFQNYTFLPSPNWCFHILCFRFCSFWGNIHDLKINWTLRYFFLRSLYLASQLYSCSLYISFACVITVFISVYWNFQKVRYQMCFYINKSVVLPALSAEKHH